ncbi:hypothetical protein [Flavobacterium sp.]|jgi:hypothetical protein|uniref:hypothetical protein n=1 Tax=Flavobacterium sp. TaxID=239 RepID=UPI0037BEF181
MKKIVVGCLFLVAFSSQGQGRGIIDVFQNTGGSVLRSVTAGKDKDNAIGSPYVNDLFLTTQISGTENVFQTRYNAYTDEVEVRHDDAVFVIPKEDQFSSIYYKLADSKLKLMRYNVEKEEYKYGYLFELYVKETFGIYKRERVTFQDERQPVNGYSLPTPPKYTKNSPEYYLKMDETKVIPFPKNKKALISLFSNNEEKINTFLKSEKISFKDEADLIKLTQFLATL